jgi:hypothetical protein
MVGTRGLERLGARKIPAQAELERGTLWNYFLEAE